MSAPLTYNQTVRGITEFIEVAIHTILYVRQIYPADLFIRRKKYDTPVFQSRHPGLNEYIANAVKAIGEQLLTGNLEKVVVIIKNKEQIALERFLFSIENIVQIEEYDKRIRVEDALSASQLGQYFRGFLVKLNMIESQLGQMYLGEDVSFTVSIELKAETVPNTKDQNPPPWIPAFTQHTTAGTSDESELHMIRAVNTGIINLSLAVQETDVKIQRERAEREKVLGSLKKPPPPQPKDEETANPVEQPTDSDAAPLEAPSVAEPTAEVGEPEVKEPQETA